MTEINRKAGAIWKGDSRSGEGVVSTESQALFEKPYTYKTRFDDDTTGTNPEELIAAAHAACFSMALASTLKKNGYDPKETDTIATLTMKPQNGGFAIANILLHVRSEVPKIDNDTYQNLISEADKHCPVSNLLREGLSINIDATLV